MLKRLGQRGVGLIELMVALVIAGILMAVAAPSFSNWIAGTRIRSTAEALIAGLQYAKSEATGRNTQVRFQLTTSLDASCELSTSGRNWVVDVVDTDPDTDSVAHQCNATPDGSTAPSILQVRSENESGNVQVSADSDQVIFNGFGRQSPIAPATTTSAITFDIVPASGVCAANGGPITCLRIIVAPAGQIRMCNPAIASGDPQAC
ncbi:MAG: hypothetical protein DI603_02810 [Roseateles depolymerans]|uniref:Type II secretion system protein H n=1 Tax=Roseateles depolymerans TaxID=76731 RepID=A0A2W5E2I3_9BURK|nr:MAG: hypothetical protein DI603_02810 [Roseateles depolymerans]